MLCFSRMSTPVHPCPPETIHDHLEIVTMKHLKPESFDAAFVAPGTQSLADVIDGLLLTLDVLGTRTRDMVSGLRTVARAIGRTPEEIPADPHWLRTRLAKVEPAALGLTAKTWSNAREQRQGGARRSRHRRAPQPQEIRTLAIMAKPLDAGSRLGEPDAEAGALPLRPFPRHARRRAAGRHGRRRRRVPRRAGRERDQQVARDHHAHGRERVEIRRAGCCRTGRRSN